jgi:hypothetical protein
MTVSLLQLKVTLQIYDLIKQGRQEYPKIPILADFTTLIRRREQGVCKRLQSSSRMFFHQHSAAAALAAATRADRIIWYHIATSQFQNSRILPPE